VGFRPEPTIYNLKFEGTALDGLHVRMSCCTIKEYNLMLKAAVGGGFDEEMIESNEHILDLFASHLISWDLEDMAGVAVPPNRDGIDQQERAVIAQLVGAWQVALVSVPNRSKPESSTGSVSEEASLELGSVLTNPGN
jgi:hypothetical protein